MSRGSWCCRSWWHPSSISSATSQGWPWAKQAGDCLVDIRPVCLDFVQCWPRDHAAPGRGCRAPECLVGIKQEREPLIERPVALRMGENHRQKNRSCVRGVTSQGSRRSSAASLRPRRKQVRRATRSCAGVEPLKVAERERRLKRCAGAIASPHDEFGIDCRNAHGTARANRYGILQLRHGRACSGHDDFASLQRRRLDARDKLGHEEAGPGPKS